MINSPNYPGYFVTVIFSLSLRRKVWSNGWVNGIRNRNYVDQSRLIRNLLKKRKGSRVNWLVFVRTGASQVSSVVRNWEKLCMVVVATAPINCNHLLNSSKPINKTLQKSKDNQHTWTEFKLIQYPGEWAHTSKRKHSKCSLKYWWNRNKSKKNSKEFSMKKVRSASIDFFVYGSALRADSKSTHRAAWIEI